MGSRTATAHLLWGRSAEVNHTYKLEWSPMKTGHVIYTQTIELVAFDYSNIGPLPLALVSALQNRYSTGKLQRHPLPMAKIKQKQVWNWLMPFYNRGAASGKW